MAGAGYKLFNTGDVLTAAQVNTYLMEQTVMVFADAAARTAALSGVVSEGMISYLKDTNAVEVYNGSAWVASDDPNAIQNTIVDAKGDLITATAADTPARLAVGNNGETLVADSSASTGLRWNPAISTNFCINGGFDIWQRGTSSTTNAAYNSADRWWVYYGAGTSTFSRESTIIPSGAQYCLKITQSVATNTNLEVSQALESNNAIMLAGKRVVVSAYVAASASTTLTLDLVSSSSTDVAPGGSWTGITKVEGTNSATVSTTASFTRLVFVCDVPSTAKSLKVRLTSSSVASGTNVYFGNAQLELGSTPTEFRRTGGTLAGELAACQRYYIRYSSTVDTNAPFANGICYSTTAARMYFGLPVQMRGTAVTVDFSTLQFIDSSIGVYTVSAVTSPFNFAGNSIMVDATISGGTQGRSGWLRQNGAASSSFIGFSAEL